MGTGAEPGYSRPSWKSNVIDDLDRGDLDLALGDRSGPLATVSAPASLLEDRWCC